MADPAPTEATEPTDIELVSAVCGGDRAPFAILVRRHNQRLFRAARAIVGDDAEAEDVVQQAYLDAFRNLSQFRGDAAFSTWLTKITVNAATTRVRGRRRLAEVVDLADAGTGAVVDSAHEAVANRELARLIERHIDDLPEALRVVLVLRDLEELDTAETAEVLGLSLEAVRVRLHRARGTLQAVVAAEIGRELGGTFRYLGDRCAAMQARVMAAIDLV
jgi:RNA polymerase sigma-70 factor (ECF subfamily)